MITLTVDTREKDPWRFPTWLCAVERGTLRTGDYAVKGDAGFAVERKSLEDFVGTVAVQSRWERFCREIARAREAGFTMPVVVEAEAGEVMWTDRLGKLEPPAHGHPLVTPQLILKRMAQIQMAGGSVVFAGDANGGAAVAWAMLRERSLEIGVHTG